MIFDCFFLSSRVESLPSSLSLLLLSSDILFSMALTVGSRLESVENFNITEAKAWLVVVVLTVYFSPLVSYAWEKIEGWEAEKVEDVDKKESNKILYLPYIFAQNQRSENAGKYRFGKFDDKQF